MLGLIFLICPIAFPNRILTSLTQRQEAEAHCQCHQASEPKAGCLTPRPVRRCPLPIDLHPVFCPCPLDTRGNHLKHLRKLSDSAPPRALLWFLMSDQTPFLLCPNPEYYYYLYFPCFSFYSLISFVTLNIYLHFHCGCVCACKGIQGMREVRGQLAGDNSSLHHVGPRDQLWCRGLAAHAWVTCQFTALFETGSHISQVGLDLIM